MDSLNMPAIDALAAPYIKLSKKGVVVDPRPAEPPFPPLAKAVRTKSRRVFGFRNKDGGRIFASLRMRDRTAAERFSGLMRQRLTADMLPEVAAAAKRAQRKLRELPLKQGRQQTAEERYVEAVADVLAGLFSALTGIEPVVNTWSDAYGRIHCPFLRLVASVFKMAGIQQKAKSAARAASERFRSRRNSI
jgi:hypothetical protein